jgi:hypothetical protein
MDGLRGRIEVPMSIFVVAAAVMIVPPKSGPFLLIDLYL